MWEVRSGLNIFLRHFLVQNTLLFTGFSRTYSRLQGACGYYTSQCDLYLYPLYMKADLWQAKAVNDKYFQQENVQKIITTAVQKHSMACQEPSMDHLHMQYIMLYIDRSSFNHCIEFARINMYLWRSRKTVMLSL